MSECPNCPVCRSVYVRPRIYECGHSICETCMHGVDEYTERYFNELPNYRCPVCRQETLVPWYRRPINQTLQGICETFPEYESRVQEVEKLNVSKDNIEDNIDLQKLAIVERKRIAKQHYKDILPVLVKCAREGSSSIVISSKEKVRSISKVMDLFSGYLFRHKIYRIIAAHDEIIISILKQDNQVSNEYTNPELEEEGEEREETTFSRISRAVDRLSITDLQIPTRRISAYSLPSLPSSLPPRRLSNS